ncbi:MAG: putative ABC transporter permease [Acetatifactor sp.]|nr:putative ABC transporter permease [Acetatifactor sp.]MDE6701238.1 putative ABC transporter permease [Acetatifactor sp.]
MWTKELFGTDVYHLVAAFVLYSMLGWLVESIYMSFCNHKITNRGFGKGPFCPIYGFGAVACYLLLSPLKGHYVALYIIGAILATIFEFIVGKGMIKFLGELWWDYNDKPFNYKGIICLESTIAWGFYAIGIIHFVNAMIYWVIDKIDYRMGIRLVVTALVLVLVDYAIQLTKVFDIDVREKRDHFIERCHAFLNR